MKQFVTYEEIHAWCMQIAGQIVQDEFSPTVIMGITRGGLIPAVIISHELGVPLITHHVSLRDHAHQHTPNWCFTNQDRLLIVDDINDSGATIQVVNSQLVQMGMHANSHMRWATLITKISSPQRVDYHAHVVHPDESHIWWCFPWEKTAHKR
jgi:uncharacterized protein